MLLEKLPDVQSLAPEEKWLLIDELWGELAQYLKDAPPDAQTFALLEARFSEYLANPTASASPADEVFARLAERKRQWK